MSQQSKMVPRGLLPFAWGTFFNLIMIWAASKLNFNSGRSWWTFQHHGWISFVIKSSSFYLVSELHKIYLQTWWNSKLLLMWLIASPPVAISKSEISWEERQYQRLVSSFWVPFARICPSKFSPSSFYDIKRYIQCFYWSLPLFLCSKVTSKQASTFHLFCVREKCYLFWWLSTSSHPAT